MTNTFTAILLLFFFQVGLGQNEANFKLPNPSLPEGQSIPVMLPFKHQDPLKGIEALQHFNEKGKKLQTRGAEIYQLDSTIQRIPTFTGDFKRVRHYQYGNNGKTKTAMITGITPDGDTFAIQREEFLYNDLDLVSQFDWWYTDFDTGVSINYTRLYLSYNSSQLLETYLDYYYTGSTELEPGDSIIYSYNSYDLPVLILHYNWDDSTSTWVESYKEEFTYNALKQLIFYKTAGKVEPSSPWVYYSRQDYSYFQGQLQSIIYNTRNNDTWEYSALSEFDYDNRGNLLMQSDKVWIPEGFQWEDDMLYLFEYDGEDNRITATDRRWFQDGHEWILGDSLSFEYNQVGDTTMIWLYSGKSASSPWVLYGGGRYQYYAGIPFSEIRWPQSYLENLSTTFKYMVTGSLLSDYGDSHSMDSLEYYYSVITTAVKDIQPGPVSFYPNPAVDFIQFNIPGLKPGAQIKLYTLSGSQSLSTTLNSSQTIDVSQLTSGVYVFEIRNGREVFSGKVILQH